jgi:transposase
MRCKDRMTIIEVLRLGGEGRPVREITGLTGCPKSTVGDIMQRARDAGLAFGDAEKMDEAGLHAVLYPSAGTRPFTEEIDWKAIEDRLKRFRRLNLRFIWEEEYIRENPDGLSYSQFCKRYRDWREDSVGNLVMVIEHDPGKELFVDWAGDTLDCVADADGTVDAAHFFVATLGDSHYPYVEAFPDEGTHSWITAHIHAFEWIGGIPRVVVPDNCKTAVTSRGKIDISLNSAYRDMADHYKVGIVPARVRKPRDKGIVEGSVGYLETWLLEWLRGCLFGSFAEPDAAIRGRLAELSERPFTNRADSRGSVFAEIDKPALQPLPAQRYEIITCIDRKVPDNYHVEFDDYYYSVPHALYRSTVTIRANADTVEIIDAERRRVAVHMRRQKGDRRRYATDTAHMPPNHKAEHGFRCRDGDSYRKWASSLGAGVGAFIDRLLKSDPVEETRYRSCMAILQMHEKHGVEMLDAACGQALERNMVSYSGIKTMIARLEKEKQGRPLPGHGNLRDPGSFK